MILTASGLGRTTSGGLKASWPGISSGQVPSEIRTYGIRIAKNWPLELTNRERYFRIFPFLPVGSGTPGYEPGIYIRVRAFRMRSGPGPYFPMEEARRYGYPGYPWFSSLFLS